MHPRKYFTPAEGVQVLDPATLQFVPPTGKWVLASSYWHRRVAEESGKLSDSAPDSVPAPAEDAGPAIVDRT